MLICMGRQVSFDLAGRKKLDAPVRNGMLHDPSGKYWSACSLLIAPFNNGDEEADDGAGRDYFGRNATVYEGRCELPDKTLSRWRAVGTVAQVFYDRAGTKYPGYYKHKFNSPRGVYKLVALFKKRVAESKVVLYKLDNFYRLELPNGCIVDDRGIVLP